MARLKVALARSLRASLLKVYASNCTSEVLASNLEVDESGDNCTQVVIDLLMPRQTAPTVGMVVTIETDAQAQSEPLLEQVTVTQARGTSTWRFRYL